MPLTRNEQMILNDRIATLFREASEGRGDPQAEIRRLVQMNEAALQADLGVHKARVLSVLDEKEAALSKAAVDTKTLRDSLDGGV